MPDDLHTLHSQIRTLLLREWDPHNAAGVASAQCAYDAYISPLIDLLRSGATEDAIVEWLHEREKESLCFPSLGTQRLRRVARMLRALER